MVGDKIPVTSFEWFADEMTPKNIVEEISKEITDEIFEGSAERFFEEIFKNNQSRYWGIS